MRLSQQTTKYQQISSETKSLEIILRHHIVEALNLQNDIGKSRGLPDKKTAYTKKSKMLTVKKFMRLYGQSHQSKRIDNWRNSV